MKMRLIYRITRHLTEKLAVSVAQFFHVLLASYLLVVALTTPKGQLAILGITWLTARPLLWGSFIFGVASAMWLRSDRLRLIWLVFVTVTSFGRGLDLFFNGSPVLVRSQEIRGSLAWVLLWGLAITTALLQTAYVLIRREAARALGDDGGV